MRAVYLTNFSTARKGLPVERAVREKMSSEKNQVSAKARRWRE